MALTLSLGGAFADNDGTDSLGGNIDVADGAISSNEVANNSLTADDLATDSVGADELDADGVAREVGTALLGEPTVAADFADGLAKLEGNASALLGDLANNSNETAQGQLASAITERTLSPGLRSRLDQTTQGIDTANRGV